MLPTKFWFIWPNSFRGEGFKKSANQKQEWPMVAMFVNGSGRNNRFLLRRQFILLQQSQKRTPLITLGRFDWLTMPCKTRSRAAVFLACLTQKTHQNGRMSNLYRGPSIDASYQVSNHLAKWFQRRRFLEIDQSELPVVAMFVNGSGQNEQSLQRTSHRCFQPSFGSFGQAVSEEKNFKNQPIRNKSRLWQPCLLTDRDKMNNLYRESSIDASYQVSVHLAKRLSEEKI